MLIGDKFHCNIVSYLVSEYTQQILINVVTNWHQVIFTLTKTGKLRFKNKQMK